MIACIQNLSGVANLVEESNFKKINKDEIFYHLGSSVHCTFS